ncbi:hypothetical protein SAMN05216464_103189 [Mucilaginibacter pineti]|uniref:Uncharacterized protein n=1 Tax=Mucilaginibacter pineti TaxID=1391627 RepID=A0A1G6Z1Y3_9SPHI|nr:hypothetical protein [Mucilaginibacter pineti]SDD96744.1 hypothetical protein SAMN05216464_103189 [Mucilaginibacter pineti]
MLQNRVDPFGRLIRTAEWRLAWQRGVIHNAQKEIVRLFKIKPWITCVLEFRGRHREIMRPDRWTELFFFDEATAFSAGHRPCFQCRYADHQRFKMFWLKGNPAYGFDMKTPVALIDAVLHAERITKDQSKVTYEEAINLLPEGTFVTYEQRAYLIKAGQLLLWSPAGNAAGIAIPQVDKVRVLTPRSFVNIFRAGYVSKMG